MELRRWPRKNDPESIKSRQDELRALTQDGEVFSHDLTPFAQAQEAVTGVAVIPVSVIGPLDVELGEYELEEPFGRLVETRRAADQVYVPLGHTEGGLSASRVMCASVSRCGSRSAVPPISPESRSHASV